MQPICCTGGWPWLALMRSAIALGAALLLAACVSTPPPPVRTPTAPQPRPTAAAPPAPVEEALPPPVAGFRQPELLRTPGLEEIIRADSASLTRRFGPPRLQVAEGDMVKLQFAGEACVLDLFLYPLSPGAEPVATWAEARRRSDGAAVDRAACARALGRGR